MFNILWKTDKSIVNISLKNDYLVIIYFDCNVFSVIFSVMFLNWADCQHFHYFLSFFKTLLWEFSVYLVHWRDNILFFHYFLENFLGVFWFFCKNVTNFGYPSLNCNNPTDHNQGPGKWVGRVGICPPNIQTNSIKTSIMEPRNFEIPKSSKKIRGFAHPIF